MNDYIRRKAEYIDREAAIESLCCDCSAKKDCRPGERCVDYQRLKDIPAADVRPVVRGMWLTQEYMYGTEDQEDCWIERKAEEGDTAYCSICRKTAGIDEAEDYFLSNFCPNCGADMRGEGSND